MSPKSAFDGVKAVVEMLNQLDSAHRKRLLADIAQKDPSLAKKIESQLFSYEQLGRLEDASLQALLREVPRELLVLSLRNASSSVKEAIFRNQSRRGGEMLQQEVDALGPQRLTDVQAAQAQIAQLAVSLEEQGKISIRRDPE